MRGPGRSHVANSNVTPSQWCRAVALCVTSVSTAATTAVTLDISCPGSGTYKIDFSVCIAHSGLRISEEDASACTV